MSRHLEITVDTCSCLLPTIWGPRWGPDAGRSGVGRGLSTARSGKGSCSGHTARWPCDFGQLTRLSQPGGCDGPEALTSNHPCPSGECHRGRCSPLPFPGSIRSLKSGDFAGAGPEDRPERAQERTPGSLNSGGPCFPATASGQWRGRKESRLSRREQEPPAAGCPLSPVMLPSQRRQCHSPPLPGEERLSLL